MRQRRPDVDLDTCHGAFLFHKPLAEAMGVMTCYDLIVIDEAPQLFEEHFDRLHEMRIAAGKAPCVVFAGDPWQLPPPDNTKRSLVHHPKWQLVHRIELRQVWRQGEGDPLLAKLAFLRKNRPMGAEGARFLRDLCRKHKAWSGHHEPTNLDIEDLLEKTDNATTAGCASASQSRCRCSSTRASTKNMDKGADYVNGMAAVVQSFDVRKQAAVVKTETGQTLCICPVTTDDVPEGRVTFYPLRPGYAPSNKFQGAELAHVTFWPDRPGCPAAGDVALSRVRKDADHLLGGNIGLHHFVPAT